MKQPQSKSILILLILILTASFVFPWGAQPTAKASPPEPDAPNVDPELLDQFDRSDSVDFLIYFEEQADLSPAYAMDWEARGQFVYETLTATADAAQAEVRGYLTGRDVDFQPFWVQNVIAVSGSTRATLDGLLLFPEIKTLTVDKQVYLIEPVSREAAGVEPAATRAPMDNLTHINADDAWALGFDGTGMVVANIDTGVRYTHDALVDQYRGNLGGSFNHNYNWWDARDTPHSSTPVDIDGHGSHTAGIMIGTDGSGNEIGVAPDAQWIACNAFTVVDPQGNVGAYDSDLLECGQFLLAPTDLNGNNANPSKRPHVVNNSWGDCGTVYDDWYEDTVDAWLAAGIYPVFANGNAGGCGYDYPPGLGTVGNPARGYNVTGVGSTGNSDGLYADHSNWGPTDSLDTLNPLGYPDLKPQVVAPGKYIRSAVNNTDNAYANYSGTSMSAPHVAGLVVLMWQAGDCLLGDYVTTETLLQQSAMPVPVPEYGQGNDVNYATGWGEIDALAAVNAAMYYCNSGTLNGTVTNSATSQPIANATVTAKAQGDAANDRSTTTDSSGNYSMAVPSGETYDLTASKNGYQPDSVSNIDVVNIGDTVTTNFSLSPNTTPVTLSGTVTDGGGHGYPLYAHVTLDDGEKIIETYTHAFTGTYSVVVYQDTVYTFKIASMIAGYNTFTNSSATFTAPSATKDAALTVRKICTAPGYRVDTNLKQVFTSEVKPETWAVWDAAGNGDYWQFNDPTALGNLTGGSGGFANIDSSGVYAPINTSLVTPSLDLSSESQVKVAFKQDLYAGFSIFNAKANLEVSVGGGAWQTVLQQTASVRGPNQQEIDISAWAANQPDVRIRFHYYDAYYSGWWQVDDVWVGSLACEPYRGGVLAGFVTDSSAVLRSGVTVSSATASTQTIATPDDPILPDGFFWLFNPMTADSQTIAFTAYSANYGKAVMDVALVKNVITRQDFQLDLLGLYLPLFYNQTPASLILDVP